MDVISGTALLGFPELCTELGVDPAALLSGFGVHVEECGRPDTFLSLRSAVKAVEHAAHATATPDFGRRLAHRQGIEILGPVGVAARTANTFGDALAIFERFMSAYSPGIAVPLVLGPDPGAMFLEWRLLLDPPLRHVQTVELSLGITLSVLRFLMGSDFSPQAVHLAHDPQTDAADYPSYFGCPARFSQPANGFRLRGADLGRALAPDPLAHQTAVSYLSGMVDVVPRSASRSVADAVRALLPTGTVGVDLVAAQFGLHPKALQRRLSGEGTSFTAVVDGVRRDVAERCLVDTEMGLLQVSRQVGFAEQSVLTRACRRWFGASPSAVRAAGRAAR